MTLRRYISGQGNGRKWRKRWIETSRAEILFQNDPALWINAYLEAGPAERRGFIGALDFASNQQLDALARSAIERLADQPSLTAVAGKSALRLGDRELLQYTLALGSGPDLHHILKAISLDMDAEGNKQLLFQTIRQGPDSKAGLAIAQLAPGLLDDPEVRDRMFDMLEDRNLGASAALVLGSSADPEVDRKHRKLRQALTCAFNTREWITFYNNRILRAVGPIPPGNAGYEDRPSPYPFDLRRARRLLAEAGYPEGRDPRTGRRLKLTLELGSADPESRQSAELLASFMEKIGVVLMPNYNNWPNCLQK